jgi:hypothetical protein
MAAEGLIPLQSPITEVQGAHGQFPTDCQLRWEHDRQCRRNFDSGFDVRLMPVQITIDHVSQDPYSPLWGTDWSTEQAWKSAPSGGIGPGRLIGSVLVAGDRRPGAMATNGQHGDVSALSALLSWVARGATLWRTICQITRLYYGLSAKFYSMSSVDAREDVRIMLYGPTWRQPFAITLRITRVTSWVLTSCRCSYYLLREGAVGILCFPGRAQHE